MPETHMHVRWPDGSETQCYSPSMVIADYLQADCSYAVGDFVRRARMALDEASDRLRAKLGFPSASASLVMAEIEATAGRFDRESQVQILGYR